MISVPGPVAALAGRPSKFHLGGRLDESFLISRSINHVRDTYFRPGLVNIRGEPLKLVPFVADIRETDGFAVEYQGTHYLGLTIGHFTASYVLGALAAKLGAFWHSPDSERDSISDIELPTRLRIGETFFQFATDPAELDRFLVAIKPIDPVKRKFAHRLAFAMNTFGLLHELGHAQLGHCVYASRRLGLRRLSERARPALQPANGDTAILLEAAADWWALANLLHTHADANDHFPDIFGTRLRVEDQLGVLFLACFLITMSWFAEDDISRSESSVHPRPMVRAMLMSAVVHAQAKANGVSEVAVDNAMQFAVSALKRIEEYFPDVEAIRDLGRDEQDYIGAIDRLIVGSDALKPLLAEYSYEPR